MADIHNQGIRIIADSSEEHKLYYMFSIPELDAKQVRSFVDDYHTSCDRFTTSWRFEMIFERQFDNNCVFRSLALRRKDSTNRHVEVVITVSYFDGNHPHPFYSEHFKRDRMLPDSELHESVARIIQYARPRIYPYNSLVVKVSIFIRNCHSESSMDSATIL
ncbi:hypothetical protein HNY73_019008 [Argiope bruennichi]|uniref:Uncharacterized protein n=1 Tax=Argiope bruennichi TaxID=94029 RepID=A0A8T0EFD6_ARGBR|nr:hypothetical protein HNY73_019008 [Argiope bruennichi]